MSDQEQEVLRLSIKEIRINPREITAIVALSRGISEQINMKMLQPLSNQKKILSQEQLPPLTKALVNEMSVSIGYHDPDEVPAIRELNDIILEKTREMFRSQLELPNYGEEQKQA